MYEPLKEQIKTTIRNLERGEVMSSDRIFLNHILEGLEFIVEDEGLLNRQIDAADSLWEMVGSTNELVEDGLD